MKVLMRPVFTLLLLPLASLAANVEKDVGENNLARVAIIPFLNSDQSKSHQWLEKSLPGAIKTSMKKRFEFRMVKENVVSNATRNLKTKPGRYSNSDLEKIAKSTGADIVIGGFFSFLKAKSKLRIEAIVYDAQTRVVMGKTSKKSSLDQKVFATVDLIAKDIVDQIYGYATRDANKAVKETADAAEKLRLLVLVPSYKTKKDKKRANAELQKLKKDLSSKFSGKYLTIFEYYRENKINKETRKRINRLAKKRKQKKIIDWLTSRGVKDAFIILVRKQKVAITPVVSGKSKKKISYKAGAKAGVRQKAVRKMVETAGLKKPVKEKKVTLKSIAETKKKRASKLYTVRLLAGAEKPLNRFNETIPLLFAGQVNAGFNWFGPRFGPWFSVDFRYGRADIAANDTWFTGAKAGLFFNFLQFRRSDFSVFVAGGAHGGKVNSGPSFIVPVAEAGTVFDFSMSPRIALSFMISMNYIFDKVTPGIIAQASLGAGYRL